MTKRRGRGEGGIYKRANGRWYASYEIGDGVSGRVRKEVSGKTRREVQDKLKALQRKIDEGVDLRGKQQTVAQFLEHWLEQHVKPTTRPLTYRGRRGIIHNHLIPHLGRHKLDALKPEPVQTMVTTLLASLEVSTVREIVAVLKAALNVALKWGKASRNVANLITLPKAERRPAAVLTPHQARALLITSAGDPFRVAYALGLLGLRIGEVRGLRWSDIADDYSALRVNQTIQHEKGHLIQGAKTDSSARAVPLPTFVGAILREHRDAQQKLLHDGAGEATNTYGLVLCNERGLPWSVTAIHDNFYRALDRAELPRIRFHDLRHSCATLLLAEGVPLPVVAAILGHAKPSTTADIYGHMLPKADERAIEGLGRMLSDDVTSDNDEANEP